MSLPAPQRAIESVIGLYNSGKLKQAVAVARKLIRAHPDTPMLYNVLGASLAARKRYREAIAAYSKLLELEPNLAPGYMNIGHAQRGLGDIDKAIECYKKAIELNPQFFEAYFNLGIALQDLGELEGAIESYRLSIDLQSNDPEVHYNLGTALQLAGRSSAAADSYRKVLELQPDYIEAYINLGIALRDLGRFDEALDSYRIASALEPNSFVLQNNIAATFEAKGNIDEAALAYLAAIELQPDRLETHANLMQLYDLSNRVGDLRRMVKSAPEDLAKMAIFRYYTAVLLERDRKYAEAAETLEKLSFNKDPITRADEYEAERIGRLAKLYDRLDRTQEAYNNFVLNNEMNHHAAGSLGCDKDSYLADISYRRDYFNPESFENWQSIDGSSENRNPVFLVGFPRSGTTLMDTILRSHPDIVVYEEKPAFETIIREVGGEGLSWLATMGEARRAELETLYLQELYRLEAPPRSEQLIVDKLPLNIVHVGEILRVFPGARFIFALRNPADCVLSCFMQPFRVNDSMANFFTLQDSANLYNSVMTLWEQYRDVLPVRSVTLKYENLITDIEGTMRPVLEFLELEWNEDLLSYSDTARQRSRIKTPSYNQVIQPLYRDADGRWMRYQDKMAGILKILKPWMDRYGYDTRTIK